MAGVQEAHSDADDMKCPAVWYTVSSAVVVHSTVVAPSKVHSRIKSWASGCMRCLGAEDARHKIKGSSVSLFCLMPCVFSNQVVSCSFFLYSCNVHSRSPKALVPERSLPSRTYCQAGWLILGGAIVALVWWAQGPEDRHSTHSVLSSVSCIHFIGAAMASASFLSRWLRGPQRTGL